MVKLRIKEILNAKGVSQKELSDGVDISSVYASNLVRGVKTPKMETLEKIAEFLDVDIRDLIEPTKPNQERAYIEEGTGKRIIIKEG